FWSLRGIVNILFSSERRFCNSIEGSYCTWRCAFIKKSKKPLSYKLGKSNYIHLTIDEGEIFIGRNNQQNEYLTHRFAKPTDIWFHTQDIQGSHLILRLNIEPDDMILSKVAQYAAYFSKARDTS
ncbi:hypothetical protein Q604_UNBc4C00190G0001, partial [human gut metagenome]